MAEPTSIEEKKEFQELCSLQDNIIEAPISIALLGQIMLVSTHEDFSLITKPLAGSDKEYLFSKKSDFKHISHPESFRASLLQVYNAGFRAFLGAHSNMDKIMLSCDHIGEHIDAITECITKGDNSDIEMFVPISLESLKATAKKCTDWSREIKEGFYNALKLLEEIDLACQITQKTNKDQIAKFVKHKAEVDEEKELIERKKKERENKIKEIEEERIRRKEEFEKNQKEISVSEVDIIKEEEALQKMIVEQKHARKAHEEAKTSGKLFSTINFGTAGIAHSLRAAIGGDYSERVEDRDKKKQLFDETTKKVDMLEVDVKTTQKKVKSKTDSEEKWLKEKENIEKEIETEKNEFYDLSEKISAANMKLLSNTVEKVDLEDIKNIIGEGIKQLSMLEERWRTLEAYFIKVANNLELAMEESIKFFSESVTGVLESQQQINPFKKRRILALSFEAYTQCYVASAISTSYMKISDKYLMPSIIKLGTLLTLDPENEKDKLEIKKRSEEIQLKSKDAIDYIREVVEFEKQQKDKKIEHQRTELKIK
ncbi:hypothetical protein LOD99_15716 [Oopsacas minuta]|uniref:Uncharacterized protein n=1 Tax=Oopsacas minuta TaxID=111878 RepID=A0AAV7KCF4_9METZ|nr:hypothetical protein LOD99_15716 [Oopsacas minuta]